MHLNSSSIGLHLLHSTTLTFLSDPLLPRLAAAPAATMCACSLPRSRFHPSSGLRHGSFATTSPFWIARYSTSAGTLPAGYGFYTFWQYADSGTFPGDQDYFNGPMSGLQNLANG